MSAAAPAERDGDWRVVAGTMLALTLTLGSTFTSFGLFILPVSAEYGLSRATINTAAVLPSVGTILFAPVVGRLLDRWPAKWVMVLAASLIGVSLLGMGLARSPWIGAALLFLGLPLAVLGAGTITATVLVARTFQARRGRAMALSNLGMFLGGVLVTPVVGWLIQARGWRETLVLLAVGATSGLLALAAWIPTRASDAARPTVPTRHGQAERPRASSPFLREPRFWLISIGGALSMGAAQTLTVNLIPYGQARGLGAAQAAALISIASAAGIGGTLLAAFGDRVSRMPALVLVFMAQALINLALLASSQPATLFACAAVLGIVNGVMAPTFYALLADQFGVARFGAVRGWTVPIQAVAGLVLVRLSGMIYDQTRGYTLIFLTLAAFLMLASGLLLAAWLHARRAPAPTAEALSA